MEEGSEKSDKEQQRSLRVEARRLGGTRMVASASGRDALRWLFGRCSWAAMAKQRHHLRQVEFAEVEEAAHAQPRSLLEKLNATRAELLNGRVLRVQILQGRDSHVWGRVRQLQRAATRVETHQRAVQGVTTGAQYAAVLQAQARVRPK